MTLNHFVITFNSVDVKKIIKIKDPVWPWFTSEETKPGLSPDVLETFLIGLHSK